MIREQIIAKWDSLTPQERDAWVVGKVMDGKATYPKSYGGRVYDEHYKYSTGGTAMKCKRCGKLAKLYDGLCLECRNRMIAEEC